MLATLEYLFLMLTWNLLWEVRSKPCNWLRRKSSGRHFFQWNVVAYGVKCFCKSISIIPVKRPESKPVSILSVRYERHASAEWFLQNPNWYLYRILLSVTYSMVWSCIIFYIIFETIGKRKIRRKFLGSVLGPFF